MATIIYKDKDGTLVINDTHHVMLHLRTETRARTLGTLETYKGRMTYRKYEKEKNTFRKLDAWGVNNNIVNYLATEDSMVIIYTEKGRYWITKARIKQHGQYLHFKNQGGYELQIFVPKIAWSFMEHETEETEPRERDCWDRYDDWRDAQKEPK